MYRLDSKGYQRMTFPKEISFAKEASARRRSKVKRLRRLLPENLPFLSAALQEKSIFPRKTLHLRRSPAKKAKAFFFFFLFACFSFCLFLGECYSMLLAVRPIILCNFAEVLDTWEIPLSYLCVQEL